MVWFFERGGETASCVVRRQDSGYEVAVQPPNGPEVVYRAATLEELFAHVEHAPRRLMADGWRPRFADALKHLR